MSFLRKKSPISCKYPGSVLPEGSIASCALCVLCHHKQQTNPPWQSRSYRCIRRHESHLQIRQAPGLSKGGCLAGIKKKITSHLFVAHRPMYMTKRNCKRDSIASVAPGKIVPSGSSIVTGL